jgi:hypothetical protein
MCNRKKLHHLPFCAFPIDHHSGCYKRGARDFGNLLCSFCEASRTISFDSAISTGTDNSEMRIKTMKTREVISSQFQEM